jgi:hypothetical protein
MAAHFTPSSCSTCARYANRYGHSDLVQNLVTERDNLADAKAQASPNVATGPVTPSIPDHLVDSAVNQQWRNSVGDPSMYGTTAAADPAVQLMSPKMSNPRPREPVANAPVGRRHLEGRPHPITSTRLRPSDLGEDY